MTDPRPDDTAPVSPEPTGAAPYGPPPPPVCPSCAGPWAPTDYRGPLTFRHRPLCDIDAAEVQTTCADGFRYDDTWTRIPTSFDRPATPTEAQLLAVIGEPPGRFIRVDWSAGIRRRTPTDPPPKPPTAGAGQGD